MKYALLLFAIALSGCTTKEYYTTDPGNTPLNVTSNAISVAPASAEDCANGGAVYSLFIDTNGNGLLDSQEIITNQQLVCNGANGLNGSSGLSTLFSMTRVSTGLEACASQSGLQINTGIDSNRNHTLDASEILGSQVLCDGAKGDTGSTGAAGAAGAAGSNGYNMVFQATAASSEQCSAGGSTIVMGLDVNRNGVFDPADTNVQAVTLCNGASAALPAYTPVAPIFPCGKTVPYKEVLLRLANGEILASFSDNTSGSMTRLTLVPDGTYIDTDNTSCQFSISTSNDGHSRSISWGGQVRETWSVTH